MKNLDRKQMQQVVVLGVLFLAALGYAAYQLFFAGATGASTKASAATTASAEQAAAEAPSPETTTPPWLNASAPPRDPFAIPPQFDNLKRLGRQSLPSSPVRMASAPPVNALPPMPIGSPSGATAGSALVPEPATPTTTTSETELNVTVTGIVVGERPVAILRAGEGDQRIVHPGNVLEGGYTLRAVSRDGVTIEKDGKTITLRPGGNPNAK